MIFLHTLKEFLESGPKYNVIYIGSQRKLRCEAYQINLQQKSHSLP